MSDEFDDQINFQVSSDAKALARDELNHGELSERLRELVNKIAFGEEVSEREQLERHRDELRQRKDKIRAEIRRKQADLDEIEQELTRIEERMDHLDTREDEYESKLEMLEQHLADGGHVFPDYNPVANAANAGGVGPEDVIEVLKERNPDIPEHAFQPGYKANDRWRGFKGGSR